ncbi:uncharacterized protein [Battus philenor]|uniref:uncharacterized protein n=1 Tax=Battus philenor TaxID=42288 RepID=UPI0035D1362B
MQVLGTRRIRTTAYHPAANGMVERLHRQLKASLMCHENSWLRALPLLVLLGVRSAFKDDTKASAAELVYGKPLHLPGELIAPAPSLEKPTSNPADFINQFRAKMAQLRPVPASRHIKPSTSFKFKDRLTATHALLRDDITCRALQPPYTGPYRILEKSEKAVTLDIKGRHAKVSIDRVKPAHIEHR